METPEHDDCLYIAFSLAVYGDEDHVDELRERGCDEL